MTHDRKSRAGKQPPSQTPSHNQERSQGGHPRKGKPTRKTHGGGHKPVGGSSQPRLRPGEPADYDSRIDGKDDGEEEKKWHPPAHLPNALLPGGVAENALKAAAQRQGVNQFLLKEMEEGLEYLRSHPLLNSSSANRSAEAMKACYRDVLQKKKVDRVLRYSLAVQAGITVKESMAKRAVEDFDRRVADYELVLGDLLPPRWRAGLEEVRYASNENATAAGDWGAFMRRLKSQRQIPQGLLTGCSPYDQATGGLWGVTLLAGLTGAGKTTLGLNFALGVLRHQKNAGVVVFNLEMTNDKYYIKLLSLVTGVSYRTLRIQPWPREVEQAVVDAQERLTSDILPRLQVVDRIEETAEGRATLDVMAKKIRRFQEESQVERVLVVVDRLQKLEVEHPIEKVFKDDTVKRKQLTDLEADDARMEMLLRLQKWSRSVSPHGFSVLALSRVNKTDPGRRLTLTDVPGRAELVFLADSVLLLEPGSWAAGSAEVTPTFLNVAKVRDGGLKGDIHLKFHHTISLFKEPRHDNKGNNPPSQERATGRPGGKTKRFAGK